VALRVVKGLVALVGRLPAALVSDGGRERLAERWQVLAWHLRGCPAREGLVTDAYLAHVAGGGGGSATGRGAGGNSG
jgi:hypothetical protein